MSKLTDAELMKRRFTDAELEHMEADERALIGFNGLRSDREHAEKIANAFSELRELRKQAMGTGAKP